LGQGDTKHIVLLPGTVTECFEFGWKAFDYAEEFQTPVFVLSDLDFGMNQWMTKPFEYPDVPMNRGKILWEEDLEKLTEKWGRYRDVDGDGIPYRTLMGNQHPASAYFARGTGHDDYANYSEDPEVWDANMHRLDRKFASARTQMPKPEIHRMAAARIGIIAYGSTDPAIQETRDRLAAEGYSTDYLRLRALPIQDEVFDFISEHDRTYVVEMNRDGQVHSIISLEKPECVGNLISITQNNGLPITAEWLECEILSEENK